MILKFKGIVTVKWGEDPDEYYIGDHNVVELANSYFHSSIVTIAMADDRFTGDLYNDELLVHVGSQGYSEFTPGTPAWLMLGPHDILNIIAHYQGKELTLWIADEPINTLEDYPIGVPYSEHQGEIN